MTKPFRPMLATDAELDKLRFPLLASSKLDGIRATVRDGVVYSRSNKPIPNKFVQEKFKAYEYFDGELIVGEPTAHDVYRQTTSHVMSHDKVDFSVSFYVFDHIQHLNERYWHRMPSDTKFNLRTGVIAHQQRTIHTMTQLEDFEDLCLNQGYEGLILRDPDGPYKQGRSTVKEGYLLKLKRFLDSEAVVIGFEERMENQNVATTDERGYTKRSSHRANKVGRGDLGALVLRTSEGVEFSCGTGFSDPERAEIWASRDRVLGRIAKYKYFPVGVKEAPRHPVFLGWRDPKDM